MTQETKAESLDNFMSDLIVPRFDRKLKLPFQTQTR